MCPEESPGERASDVVTVNVSDKTMAGLHELAEYLQRPLTGVAEWLLAKALSSYDSYGDAAKDLANQLAAGCAVEWLLIKALASYESWDDLAKEMAETATGGDNA